MSDKDSKYYSVGEAWEEVKYSYGAKDTAVSSLKLLGKGLYNVGRYTVAEFIPSMAEAQAKRIANDSEASQEQKEKAEELKSKASDMRSFFND